MPSFLPLKIILLAWYKDIQPQTYVTLAVGILGITRYSRLHNSIFSILMVILVNLLADLIANYFAHKYGDNTIVYNISTAIEQELTLLILYSLARSKGQRKVILVTMIIFPILSITNLLFVQKSSNFNSFTYISTGLAIAFFSYIIIKERLDDIYLFRSMVFWFTIANFIYYTIVSVVFSVLPFAIDVSYEFGNDIMHVNYVSYIIWSTLLAIGFIWSKKHI